MTKHLNIGLELDRIRADFNRELDRVRDAVHASEAPSDPGALNGFAMVTFVKKFNGTKPYTYAAIQPVGTRAWTVTGREKLVMVPWSRVIDFIRSDEDDANGAFDSIRFFDGADGERL